MTNLTASLAASVAMATFIAGPALSADFSERFEGGKPAVSGLNGKVDFGYMYLDFDGLPEHVNGAYGIGTITAPVGERFGLQIDAGLIGLYPTAAGTVDADGGGVGGHFFWRDPDQGLVGAYAHYVALGSSFADVDLVRYGVEGEFYIDRVTLEGFAGADTVDGGGASETYANLDFGASYYVTDNVKLSAGVRRAFDQTSGIVGAEAMLPFASNNVSLYANAQFSDETTSVRAGLRVYFGQPDKSLIARHREDDPESMLFDFADTAFAADDTGSTPPPPGPID